MNDGFFTIGVKQWESYNIYFGVKNDGLEREVRLGSSPNPTAQASFRPERLEREERLQTVIFANILQIRRNLLAYFAK